MIAKDSRILEHARFEGGKTLPIMAKSIATVFLKCNEGEEEEDKEGENVIGRRRKEDSPTYFEM